MMVLLHISFIVLICITSGDALLCRKCISTEESSCTGPYVSCNPGYTCASKYRKTAILSSAPEIGFERLCQEPSECGNIFNVRFPLLTLLSTTSCCNTDYCDPPQIKSSSLNTTLNGVLCPSCYSLLFDSCTPNGTIACQGLETMCGTWIHASATVKDGIIGETLHYSTSGCVTKEYCGMNYLDNNENSISEIDVICRLPNSHN
ncbi:phospholipase A2 inhibitor and Ly6/PLAUR domain-containing protein-like [Discoglossus pictus]